MRADYLLLRALALNTKGNLGARPELAQSVQAIPGITEITTIHRSGAELAGGTAQIIGLDPQTYPQLSGLLFSAGDAQTAYAQLAQGRAIILNGMLAAQEKLGPGNAITLQTPSGPQTYQVVGVGVDYLTPRCSPPISHKTTWRLNSTRPTT